MTFIEKFDELKKKYGTIDDAKLTDNFAVQVEMTDEDCGGIFYVAYMNGPFAVEPYDYRDNTASIKVSSSVLEGILSCKTDAVEAFVAGKLEVTGDLSHALMLVDLMKKEPAKKRTTKKAPEKKTPAKKEEKKTSLTKKAETAVATTDNAPVKDLVKSTTDKKDAKAKADKKNDDAKAKPEKTETKKSSKKATK